MKKIVTLVSLVMLLVSPLVVQSSELTHAIGDTGYMIQEAMWARAGKHDKANFQEALKLQKEAKAYFRGTHKKGRNLAKALASTKEAYGYAQQARDGALAVTGRKTAY